MSKVRVTLKFLKLFHADLVSRTNEQLHCADQIESELPGHIAACGRRLHDADDWRAKVLERLDEHRAAAGKRGQIVGLTRSLRTSWDGVRPDFRIRNLFTLRREQQPLSFLDSSIAVLPTCLLVISAEHKSQAYVPIKPRAYTAAHSSDLTFTSAQFDTCRTLPKSSI